MAAARPDTTRKKEEATAPRDVDEAMDVGRNSTMIMRKMSPEANCPKTGEKGFFAQIGLVISTPLCFNQCMEKRGGGGPSLLPLAVWGVGKRGSHAHAAGLRGRRGFKKKEGKGGMDSSTATATGQP